jgi:AcrR family transcriptional regulator
MSRAKKKLTRRERERLRHRREILDASCEVFAEKGYRRATIQDISHRSEFSIASIYKHFESKEDIYHSLIEYVLTSYIQTVKRALHGKKSPLQKLVVSLETTLTMFEQRIAFCQFLFGELRPLVDKQEEALSRKSFNVYWKIITHYVELFEKAIEQKEIVDISPLYLSISLLGNVYAFLNYWLTMAGKDHDPDSGPILGEKERKVIPQIFFGPIALKKLKFSS